MKSGKKKAEKVIVSLVVSAMVVGSQAGGIMAAEWKPEGGLVQIAAASSYQFDDVPVSHWSHRYVTQLAAQGIVQGRDEGKYVPNDRVSQEEVIVLAIRLMGLEQEAERVKTDNYVLPFSVSDYARGYVVTAIEKGLLNIKEESSGSPSEGKSWGTSSASREWVAKIVIRAINKQSEAEQKKSKSTGFSDNNKIADGNIGFINEAISLKIVDGFEDNTFRPDQAVTRAEMATFISRAQHHNSFQPDKVLYGTVQAITGSSVQVTDTKGQSRTLNINSDSVIYGEGNDGKISWSGIKPGYSVYAVVQNNSVNYMEIKEKVSYQTVEGKVENIDLSAMRLTLKSGDKSEVYELMSGTSVTDKNGSGQSLSDVLKDSKVEIRFTDDRKIAHITIKEAPINKTAVGTFVSVDKESKKLTVNENGLGKQEYIFIDNVPVKYKETVRSLDHLFEGDTISFRVENNIIVEVEVTSTNVEVIKEGKLDHIKLDNRASYLTIQFADGRFGTYSYDNNFVEVIMPWKLSSSIAELQVGDEVTVYLDADNNVKKLFVKERIQTVSYMATIEGYDNKTKYLIIKKNNVPEIYQLDDKISLTYNGNSVALEQFESMFAIGKKVDLTYNNNDELVNIALNIGYEGVISMINPTTKELKLKMPNNQYLDLKMNTFVGVEAFNQDNATLDDLKVGDSVKAIVGPQQDYVYSMQKKQTLSYELISKNDTNRQITVKDQNGATKSYNVPLDAKILSAGDTSLTFAQLSPGSKIEITYLGKSLHQVKVAP
ncbi:S-layer homology domain-containing protein [Paenibacillus sp. J2TS4]|uniref:S-layer homology domain-containing protein n=1 Tax=Paenibacillus sp. J2TS4 TaxID=2807194 RepID=UPI001B13B6B4|nr:S-layer homology domain-containing protein [Paenibacillus sp. J2TS4]GIP32457.1 hypothetical protein J2TS4_16670 [Paenibacillus sp. J2TS4]